MISAFDLGTRNFAFAIKNKDEFVLLQLVSLDENCMTKSDLGRLKKVELKDLMISLNINFNDKMIKKEMISLILAKYKKNGSNKSKDLALSLFEIMDSYKHFWNECNTFLIERQMVVNMQALKLSHYLEAYLKIHYPTKQVLNYNASNKTKKLGAGELKTKDARKAWTIKYVSSLLEGDTLDYYNNLSKQDDVADAICMIESYLYI